MSEVEELTVADQTEIDHYGKQAFQCPYCTLSFETESGMLHHERTRHKDKPLQTLRGNHECPECNYKSSEHGVALHRRLAHGVEGQWTKGRKPPGQWAKYRKKTTKFGCPYCEFRSPSKAGLTRHTRQQHPNETGVAMMGKPARQKAQPVTVHVADSSSMMEKVMGMVADRIYNKLMEEL